MRRVEHDQAADGGADNQDDGQKDDGSKNRMWMVDGGGILMQVSAEDEHVAADGCAAGEGEIAAEDQNVAAPQTR